MNLPRLPDCASCIEDFGVRHTMIQVTPAGPEPLASPLFLCDHHDVADPLLTIASLDPVGCMNGLAVAQPKAKPVPMSEDKIKAAIRRERDHFDKAYSCKDIAKVSEADGRGLVEVLFLTYQGEALTAYLRGDTVAYVEEGW